MRLSFDLIFSFIFVHTHTHSHTRTRTRLHVIEIRFHQFRNDASEIDAIFVTHAYVRTPYFSGMEKWARK